MREILLTAFIFFISIKLFAAPFSGEIEKLNQPDGSEVEVRIFGDEYYSRIESIGGYTLVYEKESRWICYAKLSNDKQEFVSTGIKYINKSTDDYVSLKLSIIPKHLDLPIERILEKAKEARLKLEGINEVPLSMSEQEDSGIPDLPLPNTPNAVSGKVIGLTILIDFSDDPAKVPVEDVERFMNADNYTENGNYGSVKEFWYDVSFGQLEYENIVFGYFRAPKTKAAYEAMNTTSAVHEILGLALQWVDDQGFDFSTLTIDDGKIKAINMIFAGRGMPMHRGWYSGFSADGVSSNNYCTSRVKDYCTLDIICHENGHMLANWPDLYKYNSGTGVDGINGMDLMCNTYTGGGKCPSPPNPQHLESAGWANIVDITSFNGTISDTANSNTIYRYRKSLTEYYYIKARYKTGRNSYLNDDGLTIWHIDRYGSNQTTHHLVYLEHADNDITNLSEIGWHAEGNNEFSDNTTPSANWYDGTPSGLRIWNISSKGEIMTYNIGTGIPGSDCNGDIGGFAYIDNCGECSGGSTGKMPNSTCADCNGDYGSTAFIDICGNCVGGKTGESVTIPPAVTVTKTNATSGQNDGSITFSFSETWFRSGIQFSFDGGLTYEDVVNDNVGSVTYSNLSPGTYHLFTRWSNPECPTDLGKVSIFDGEADCNGNAGGTAYYDKCNNCVGGETGKEPCKEDCNGDWGGTAYIDQCGYCIDGNTGRTDCKNCVDLAADAGNISGTKQTCSDIEIYSIDAVTNATTYEWTVPTNAVILSGQGTTSITVDFANAKSGKIEVSPSNTCSYGAGSSVDVVVNTPLNAINLGSDIELCSPSTTTLDAGFYDGATYTWTKDGNHIGSEQTLIVTNAATYEVLVEKNGSACNAVSDIIEVSSESLPFVNNDTICNAGTVDLSIVGDGSYSWYDAPDGGKLLASGTSYSTDITVTTPFYIEDSRTFESYVGPDVDNNTLTNMVSMGKQGIYITVYSPCIISELTIIPYVYDMNDINFTLDLKTSSGALISSHSANSVTNQGMQNTVSNAKSYVMVFKTPISITQPGNYLLKPSGGNDPFFFNSGANYASWTLDDVISITGDEVSWQSTSFPGIFNIKVSSEGTACDRAVVYGVVDGTSCITTSVNQEITEEKVDDNIRIYPNPNRGLFTVKLNIQEKVNLSIIDIYGNLIQSEVSNGTEDMIIDLQDKTAGVYYVKILSDNVSSIKKVVINK